MKNKLIILLVLCLTLCGCGNYAELNKLSIVTAVSFNKKGNQYELSFLIANSQKAQTSSKEGEAKTTVYSGVGKTIPEAAQAIDQISPKQLYFGHINVVIISEKIAKEGFFKVADWLIRNPQTRKNFYLLQAKDVKAKDILKIVSPLESFPSQSIATLVESNQKSKSIATAISYSSFIGKALEKGYDPILPSITIKGSIKKGSSQSNIETTEPQSYLALGSLALYKSDTLKAFTTRKESQSINILKNEDKELNYTLKYKGENISIDAEKLLSQIILKNKNNIQINVTGQGNLYNINNKIDIDDYKEIKKIEKAWEQQMENDLLKIIKKLQNKYKTDVLGFGSLIYKNNPQTWKKIEKNWNNKYFQKVKVKIKAKLKITSTGSLAETIKEAQK